MERPMDGKSRLPKGDGGPCCSVRVRLPDHEPITADQASEMEDLFKILANDTRLRLLHHLARVEEMCVCDLAAAVGMSPQAISNQLQRLSDRAIVTTRRSGNMIYYRVLDDCVIDLLQKALCLLADSERAMDRRIVGSHAGKE